MVLVFQARGTSATGCVWSRLMLPVLQAAEGCSDQSSRSCGPGSCYQCYRLREGCSDQSSRSCGSGSFFQCLQADGRVCRTIPPARVVRAGATSRSATGWGGLFGSVQPLVWSRLVLPVLQAAGGFFGSVLPLVWFRLVACGRDFRASPPADVVHAHSTSTTGCGRDFPPAPLVCEHAKSRTQFGKKLSEFGLIKEKFARMAVYAYAMESMAYRTAAILDEYDEPDASIEAAMVKIFSSEHGWILTSEALQILGGLGYMKQYPYERYLRDCRILLIFEGTNEILRMYIALTCLQHAGKELKDLVRKLKDPLNNLGLLVSKTIEQARKPKKIYDLQHKVHPNLSKDADRLEERVLQFKRLVEKYLGKYTSKIVDEQMALKRMADIAIDVYAQTSVLGRATRSKCIGLRNCDHEIMLAQTFCKESCDRIDYNLQQLDLDKFHNGDKNYEEIADLIFQNDGYVAEHPLNRTI